MFICIFFSLFEYKCAFACGFILSLLFFWSISLGLFYSRMVFWRVSLLYQSWWWFFASWLWVISRTMFTKVEAASIPFTQEMLPLWTEFSLHLVVYWERSVSCFSVVWCSKRARSSRYVKKLSTMSFPPTLPPMIC